MEDYTSKYKGEQVEVALMNGDYQDGVLTSYCAIDDVAHVELNGHILIPLQNVASLHCSSRCDAPEPDWPPRGLAEDDAATTRLDVRSAWPAIRNVLKAWLCSSACAPARRRSAGGSAAIASRSVGVFCGLMLGPRGGVLVRRPVAMGMVGARELPAGRGAGAALDSVERLSLRGAAS